MNDGQRTISADTISLLYNDSAPANVKPVTPSDDKGPAEIYSISGQRLSNTRHGVNLIHRKSGTEKVIIK